MKKLLIFAFLIVCSTSLFSKQKFGLDLGVGIKGGLNLNTATGPGLRYQYKADPHVGFFLHLNKKHAGFQIEALWSQNHITTDTSFRGLYTQYLENAGDSLVEGSFKFSTISIPILLNIKLAQFLWLQVGPQFSANINTLDKSKIIKSGVDVINQQNYCVVGGVWVQFGGKAPLLRVNAGARFVAGLNNLNTMGSSEVWRNQMIQLHLGISY